MRAYASSPRTCEVKGVGSRSVIDGLGLFQKPNVLEPHRHVAYAQSMCRQSMCRIAERRSSVMMSILEAHPERAFWEIRASKTKGLWFKKRPKTLFPDASLEIRPGTGVFRPTVGVA